MEEIGLEFDAEEVLLIEEDSTKKFELICDAKSLQTLENGLGKGGFSILQSEIEFRPVHPIDCPEAEEPKVQKLYEMLQVLEKLRKMGKTREKTKIFGQKINKIYEKIEKNCREM